MTIIHVINSINRSDGGPPKSCIDLAIQTQNQGIQTVVVYNHKLRNPYERFSEVKTYNIKTYQIYDYLKKEKDVVLHLHGLWKPYILFWFVFSKLFNIKTILSVRGMLETWSLSQGKWKKKLALFLYQKKILKHVDCIHATSVEEVISVEKIYRHSNIVNIPNAINPNHYERTKGYKKTGKIGFISRIHPKKGIEFLIKSLLYNNYTLEIYGNGDENYIQSLKLIVESYKLGNRVDFLGFLDSKAKLNALQEFEVLVLPTHSENFGVIVAEAMAMGVPVVTTINTPWKSLDQWGAGYCINLTDLDLRSVLTSLENKSEGELELMGKSGRKVIKEKFDIRLVSEKFIKLYESISI